MKVFRQLHCSRYIAGHNCAKIYDSLHLLGKPTNPMLTQAELSACVNYDTSSCIIYSRIKVNNILIHACYWNRGNNSNSAITYYSRDHSKIEYGIVQKNLYILHCNTIFLLVIQLKAHRTDLIGGRKVPHIQTCNPPSDLDIVAVDICSPCVFMSFTDINDKTFISVLADVLESLA